MRKNRGIIGIIVIIIVAIILLRVWFGFDVFTWLNRPEVKEFFTKIWQLILFVWNTYVKETVFGLINYFKGIAH